MSTEEKKILLVDNDPDILSGIRPLLESHQCRIMTAAHGLEALEKIRKEPPDLIIFDVLMPKMSGMQFIEALKGLGGKRIPVILLSSRPGMEQFFNWHDIECFLAKPFKQEDILARISKVVGRQLVMDSSSAPSHASVSASPAVSGPAPVIPSVSSSGPRKKAVVIGVEEYTVRKLISFLESSQYEVELAVDEAKTIELSGKYQPHFVFVQYWEDETRLNAPNLCKQLAAKKYPFYVFATTPLVPDALKYFSGSQILSYADTSELLRKTEAALK